MKLSIITPFFNEAATLGRCVRSIVSDGLSDMELLLVDDGSTDGSGELADALAAEHPSVRVMHRENGGLSAARNTALNVATGQYIMFVDSDDELQAGTVSHLMTYMQAHPECDILEFPVVERPGMKSEHIFNPGERAYDNALDWLSEYGLEHCWACNKVYRRHIFSNLRFAEGRKYEDVLLIEHIVKLRPRIETTAKGAYLYYWNEKGIVSQSAKMSYLPLLEAQTSVVEALGIDTRERRWHRLYMNMLTIQLHAYRQTGRMLLWPQHVVVRRYNSRNDIIKALLLNTIGLRNMCRLFARLR